MTRAGYIKRLPTSTYKAQGRGVKGITAQALKEEDVVETVFTASTHDYILFFTSKGRVYRKKGYQIPEAGRTANGTNIVNILQEMCIRDRGKAEDGRRAIWYLEYGPLLS